MNNHKILFFLNGKQSTGKTTLRKIISEEAGRFSLFADSVRFTEQLYEIQNDIVDRITEISLDLLPENYDRSEYDPETRFKDGALLQKLGDLVRGHYGEDILIKHVENAIRQFLSDDIGQDHIAVVEDGRLPLEYERMKLLAEECGAEFISIRLMCPEEIRKQRSPKTWRPNTSHATETGLDSHEYLSKFTKLFDTSRLSKDDLRKYVHETLLDRYPNHKEEPFKNLIAEFNHRLRSAENFTGNGANFAWSYTEDGRKELKLSNVAPFTKLTTAEADAAKEFVPKAMEAAESLVGTSVEITQNADPEGT